MPLQICQPWYIYNEGICCPRRGTCTFHEVHTCRTSISFRIDGNVCAHHHTVSSVPGAALHPGYSVEERLGASVACILAFRALRPNQTGQSSTNIHNHGLHETLTLACYAKHTTANSFTCTELLHLVCIISKCKATPLRHCSRCRQTAA
jgi:hypothetical protein